MSFRDEYKEQDRYNRVHGPMIARVGTHGYMATATEKSIGHQVAKVLQNKGYVVTVRMDAPIFLTELALLEGSQ